MNPRELDLEMIMSHGDAGGDRIISPFRVLVWMDGVLLV